MTRKRRRVVRPKRNRLRPILKAPFTYRFERMSYTPGIDVAAGSLTTYFGKRQWQVAGGNNPGFHLTPTFGDLISSSEYTNLFDFYKLTYCVYQFEIVYNSAQIPSVAAPSYVAAALPSISYVIDRDQHSAGSFPDVTQNSRFKTFYFGNKRVLRIGFRPYSSDRIIDGVGNLANTTRPAPWIDAVAPSIKHTGISGVVYNYSDATVAFIITARYYFMMKQQK